MLIRLYIILSEDERLAIQTLAKKDLRSLRDQIRFMLRQNLLRQGLLPDEQGQTKADEFKQNH